MIPARFDPHASVTCPGLSQACVSGGRSCAPWPWGAWGMSPEKTAQPAEQARGIWPRGGPHSQRNSAGRTPGLAPGTGCGRVDITTVRFRPSPESQRPKRPPASPSRPGPGNERAVGKSRAAPKRTHGSRWEKGVDGPRIRARSGAHNGIPTFAGSRSRGQGHPRAGSAHAACPGKGESSGCLQPGRSRGRGCPVAGRARKGLRAPMRVPPSMARINHPRQGAVRVMPPM